MIIKAFKITILAKKYCKMKICKVFSGPNEIDDKISGSAHAYCIGISKTSQFTEPIL